MVTRSNYVSNRCRRRKGAVNKRRATRESKNNCQSQVASCLDCKPTSFRATAIQTDETEDGLDFPSCHSPCYVTAELLLLFVRQSVSPSSSWPSKRPANDRLSRSAFAFRLRVSSFQRIYRRISKPGCLAQAKTSLIGLFAVRSANITPRFTARNYV